MAEERPKCGSWVSQVEVRRGGAEVAGPRDSDSHIGAEPMWKILESLQKCQIGHGMDLIRYGCRELHVFVSITYNDTVIRSP